LLGMSQPRVSRHLRILRQAGLIACTQEGKWAYYAISPSKRWEQLEKFIHLTRSKPMNKNTSYKGCH
jgi:ArsR family transcriptional regulator